MSLSIEEVNVLLNQKKENKNIDYKEMFNWKTSSKELKLGIIKDILAMMNTEGGGKLIFGVSDDTYAFIGLSLSDYQSFDSTNINDLLIPYCDPQYTCEVYKYEIEGKKVAVIDVPEFSDVPVICAKDYHTPQNKHILKKGSIYIRTNKGSSEIINSSRDMRDLIDRAINWRSEHFILKIENLLQYMQPFNNVDSNELIEKLTQIIRSQYTTNKNEEAGFDIDKLDYYIDTFFAEKERIGLAQRTIDGYKMELAIFKKYCSLKKDEEIDAIFIRQFLMYRETSFNINKKGTLEKIRGILRVFFDWLEEEKIIERNPVRKVRAYRIPEIQREELEPEEIIELQNACKLPRERAIIEVFLSTGCKLGELKKMKLNNVNWNIKTITIIGNNLENRVVPLTNNAKYFLKKYIENRNDNSDLLFVTERRPYREMSERAIQDLVAHVVDRTTITKNVTPKTLRNTFAKKIQKKGYPLNVLQALLGHKMYTNSTEVQVKITNDNIHNILNH